MNHTKPMRCEEALKNLFLYLDQDLNPVKRQQMEQHLVACRSCYSRAEFERKLKEKLADLGRGQVSEPFQQRINALFHKF